MNKMLGVVWNPMAGTRVLPVMKATTSSNVTPTPSGSSVYSKMQTVMYHLFEP